MELFEGLMVGTSEQYMHIIALHEAPITELFLAVLMQLYARIYDHISRVHWNGIIAIIFRHSAAVDENYLKLYHGLF